MNIAKLMSLLTCILGLCIMWPRDKGNPEGNQIAVEFTESSDPLSTLRNDEYALLFLKPTEDGRYAFADQHFGKLKTSEISSFLREGSTDPMELLELDLKASLSVENRDAVLTSIRQLGNMKEINSTRELKDTLPTDDKEIEGAVYLALIKLGDYTLLNEAMEFVEPKNVDHRIVRIQAEISHAISNIQEETALQKLHDFAGSENSLLRQNIVRALRAIKSPESVPVLISRLNDIDGDVRYVSLMAVATIGGKSRGSAPSRDIFDQDEEKYINLWKEWWNAEGRAKYAVR